jgi:hypothetical protein
MSFEGEKDVNGGSAAGKKPYSKPQLQVYGDLGAITASASNTGAMADGLPNKGNSKS